ncbi:MAG: Indolepyruvate oxidoreductase subunit IorB [Methanosaeta sp. PtaB.Bin039]|nr:MAG: Indolepyruvate oxidoreductase subunit IorB [Methanosaeta sp. PtaB.Bin039]HOT07523.1 indolepyruvate oxidoreductase subunit beta [Methanotrichaceae archaeon]HQF16121.1 indolepyruvate oxidoreductase subunit beta [Methanotrichaceae archaeon]HQI90765.1 indolepyruvate oxidoreductase subunit beta [Methanotrichaceae archaeon]HQJ28279.1 indolepyruvate oxidoreductase subunit beta [Methanotrichaceae archaeon]
MRSSDCDIVIAGVGGQGVILISDVIGRAAVKAGLPVRGAETHGMAQRGGSVVNHTRINCRYSPMVAEGGADLLLALEPVEALRHAHFLAPGGTALVNTAPVLPVTVTTGKFAYPPLEKVLSPLQRIGTVRAFNATELAASAGTVQAMNVVMLGALSRYIPITEEAILAALAQVVPEKHLKVNLRAFELGKAEVD